MDDYGVKNPNVFFENIGARFSEFKRNVKVLSRKANIVFDEDIFMNTILFCMNTFKNQEAKNDDIDKYFWKAFKYNTILFNERNKTQYFQDIEDIDDTIEDEEYSNDRYDIVDIIKGEVEKEFGKTILDVWLLHICEGYTYEDLEKMGYDKAFLHNSFRKIKRHILTNYANKNNKLKTLLKNNNLI